VDLLFGLFFIFFSHAEEYYLYEGERRGIDSFSVPSLALLLSPPLDDDFLFDNHSASRFFGHPFVRMLAPQRCPLFPQFSTSSPLFPFPPPLLLRYHPFSGLRNGIEARCFPMLLSFLLFHRSATSFCPHRQPGQI